MTAKSPCPYGKASGCITQVIPARGNGTLADHLIRQLLVTEPRLRGIKLQCPSGPIHRFPVTCHFTATDTGAAISKAAAARNPALAALAKPHPVVGTISPYGVDTRTGDYEYSLTFGPKH